MPQQLRIERKLIFAPGAIVEGSWNGMFDVGGRVYYVNNVTGASTNDGLSWNSAMDEVSTAVTASETYRALPATLNEYIRNTIVIQGTGTAYTALTDLGEHINFIGLGDNMLGNAAGIARIGADTGTGYGVLTTETVRGLYLYNLQFQGGQNNEVFGVTHIYRSTMEYCGIFTNGDPTSAPTYGIRIIGKAGGLHLKDCHWATASGTNSHPETGISVESTHFHICLVEGCHITGQTAGVAIGSTCVNSFGSVFRDNYIGAGNHDACTIGVNDDDTDGNIMYINNFINATTAGDLEANGAARWIGNVKSSAFCAHS